MNHVLYKYKMRSLNFSVIYELQRGKKTEVQGRLKDFSRFSLYTQLKTNQRQTSKGGAKPYAQCIHLCARVFSVDFQSQEERKKMKPVLFYFLEFQIDMKIQKSFFPLMVFGNNLAVPYEHLFIV